jgi:hypothetical protein
VLTTLRHALVLTISTPQLPATTSLSTIVDGKVIFADGHLARPERLVEGILSSKPALDRLAS